MRFGISVIVSLCVVVYAPTGPGASFSETPFSRPWTRKCVCVCVCVCVCDNDNHEHQDEEAHWAKNKGAGKGKDFRGHSMNSMNTAKCERCAFLGKKSPRA